MSDNIEYQIGGETYYQTYLTIAETAQVADILEGLDFKKFSITEISRVLIKSGKLVELFNVILKRTDSAETILCSDNIPLPVAFEVIKDFFSLNNLFGMLSTIIESMKQMNMSIDSKILNGMTKDMTGIS